MAKAVAPLDKFWSAIRRLERRRKSRIYCIVHNGDGHVCSTTTGSAFDERARFGGQEKIEVLLHSPGGHADAAYQLTRFLRERFV